MSFNDEQKIRVIFIIEILGRPPEHLTETLEEVIKKLGEEKGVKIIEKTVNEPQQLEQEKEFYTNFAEVEFEVDEIITLSGLVFRYMPAHIEILSPQKINLTNNELNTILNELTRKLHSYDEVARVLQTEKAILEKKLRDLIEKKEE